MKVPVPKSHSWIGLCNNKHNSLQAAEHLELTITILYQDLVNYQQFYFVTLHVLELFNFQEVNICKMVFSYQERDINEAK